MRRDVPAGTGCFEGPGRRHGVRGTADERDLAGEGGTKFGERVGTYGPVPGCLQSPRWAQVSEGSIDVDNVVLGIVAGAWVLEALALGYVMGRRGYEAYSWTLLGMVLGPIAVGVALTFVFRPASREPRLLRGGRPGTGSVDVLVGIDGSTQAAAAVDRVASLLGGSAGRVTLASVVPVDATRESERVAEAQLAAACAAHPELDPSTVLLRGEPVAALRDYVDRLGYEILVVGTRGEGKSRAMLGSVAMALARGAGIPVLLVDAGDTSVASATPIRRAV